jgi:hypothetical protein
MTGEVAELVQDAIACVASEHPPAYAAMEQALGARRLELEIGREHFMLDLGPTPLRASVVSIATDVATLCALVEGELGILDAVLAGRLDVLGGPDDVVAAAAAMHMFLQGALRCMSMQPLLDRLLGLQKEEM